MDNFNLKKFLGEKSLLNENAPGYDTRKMGEPLPTLESVKAAHEAKENIKEEEGFVEVSVDEVMGHINQYQMGNIDGDDLAQAVEEIVVGRIVAPGVNEDVSFGAAGTDKRSGQVISEIIQMIRNTGIDPSDVMEEIGQEFGIAFEFGRG